MKISREVARERENRAWEMRQRGFTQAAIATELGIGQSGINKALKRAERRALAQMGDRIEAVKITQHAQLERILMESLLAWERSKRVNETVKTETEADGTERVTRTVKGQTGDPRYLTEAQRALEGIRRVWGLDETRSEGADAVSVAALEQLRVKRQEPATPSPLTPEIASLGRSYALFGGSPDQFHRIVTQAAQSHASGSPGHVSAVRAVVAPVLIDGLRGRMGK